MNRSNSKIQKKLDNITHSNVGFKQGSEKSSKIFQNDEISDRIERRKSKVESGQNQPVSLKLSLLSVSKLKKKNPFSDFTENITSLLVDKGTDFHGASLKIDSASEVYVRRVDTLHSETTLLAGDLVSGTHSEHKGVDNEDLEKNENGDQNSKSESDIVKKKKSSRVNRGKTIETNESNINLKQEVTILVDPLFHKRSAEIDSSSARSLLLNQLMIHNGYEIIFDSEDKIEDENKESTKMDSKIEDNQKKTIGNEKNGFMVKEDNENDITNEDNSGETSSVSSVLFELFNNIFPKDLTNHEVCPNCPSLFHSKLDGDLIEDDNDTSDHLKKVIENQNSKSAGNGENEFIGNDNYDWDDYDDYGGENNIYYEQEKKKLEDELNCIQKMQESGNTLKNVENYNVFDTSETDMNHTVNGNDELDELDFIDPNKLDSWAGPSFWKYKGNRSAQRENNIANNPLWLDEEGNPITEDENRARGSRNKKEKNTAKKQFRIDFDQPIPDLSKYLESGGSSCDLPKVKLYKQLSEGESALSIPPDIKYDPKNFLKFFFPRAVPINKKLSICDTNGFGKSNYQESAQDQYHGGNNLNGSFYDENDYEDNDESNNFKIDYDLEKDYNNGNFEDPNKNSSSDDDHLDPVLSMFPNVAKLEKTVDLKTLKKSIWSSLCLDKNISNVDSGDKKNVNIENKKMKMRKDFGKVLESVTRAQPQLTNKLTVPYCFVCLLHLANEKRLNLNQVDNNSIVIEQIGQ